MDASNCRECGLKLTKDQQHHLFRRHCIQCARAKYLTSSSEELVDHYAWVQQNMNNTSLAVAECFVFDKDIWAPPAQGQDINSTKAVISKEEVAARLQEEQRHDPGCVLTTDTHPKKMSKREAERIYNNWLKEKGA